MTIFNLKIEKYLNKDLLQGALFFAFPLTLFCLLLSFPPSIKSTWRFYYLDAGFSALWIFFFALLLGRKGFIWDTLSLSMVLLLFAMPLIYKWQNPHEGDGLVGGILPWSDASGYYAEAQRLLITGSHFSVWGTRRPLFAGFLSVILFLCRNNLQAGLAVLVAVNAIAVYFTAREVQKSLRYAWAAAAFLVLCYIYYRIYAGVMLTENLGFPLGLLGLMFLLNGARKEDIRTAALGVFTLTLALSARAGAFFILPALAIWIGYAFQKKSQPWWQPVVIGFLAVAFGFGANTLVSKLVGDPNGTSFSNFGHTLYGLAVGYKSWQQVYIDYPGIAESKILPLAIEKIRENPLLFITGMERSYLDYFGRFNGAFSFIYFGRRVTHETTNMILWAGTAAGLIFAFIRRKDKLGSLMLLSFLGILASVSMLAPNDSSRMRVYAATIPISIFIALLGISLIGKVFERGILKDDHFDDAEHTSYKLGLPFAITVIAFCIFGPIILKILPHEKLLFQKISCPLGQEEMILHTGTHAGLSLVPDESISESYLPAIRISDYRGSMETDYSGYSPFVLTMRSLDAGNILSLATRFYPPDYRDATSLIFLVTRAPLAAGFHQVCAAPLPGDANKLSATEYYLYSADVENSSPVIPVLERDPYLMSKLRVGYNLLLWIIIFGAIFAWAGIQTLPPKKQLLLFGNIALVSFGAIVFLHTIGLTPLIWERTSISAQDIHPKKNHSYFVNLATSSLLNLEFLLQPARLYEDGNLTNAQNNDASLGLIGELGGGRFAVANGDLFFSASDNSDPRTNGKRYEAELPAPVRTRYQIIAYVMSLIGLFLYKKYFWAASLR